MISANVIQMPSVAKQRAAQNKQVAKEAVKQHYRRKKMLLSFHNGTVERPVVLISLVTPKILTILPSEDALRRLRSQQVIAALNIESDPVLCKQMQSLTSLGMDVLFKCVTGRR